MGYLLHATAFSLCLLCFFVCAGEWVTPSPSLRYDQVCFLTAHNAFSNAADGWRWYKQQAMSIKEQLDFGIRGLMLDIHDINHSLVLCHGDGTSFSALQRGICSLLASFFKTPHYKKFIDTIGIIKKWLDSHPTEIVTLFLESYVRPDVLDRELRKVKDFTSLVLTPKDWDIENHYGKWPKIHWMCEHNKRIVLFIEDKTRSLKSKQKISRTYLFHSLWHHVIESRYGTLRKVFVCGERSESVRHRDKRRELYLINYFSRITSSSSWCRRCNSYATLKELVHLCHAHRGKMPNFIALDFANKGDALRVIDEINCISSLGVLFSNSAQKKEFGVRKNEIRKKSNS